MNTMYRATRIGQQNTETGISSYSDNDFHPTVTALSFTPLRLKTYVCENPNSADSAPVLTLCNPRALFQEFQLLLPFTVNLTLTSVSKGLTDRFRVQVTSRPSTGK